MAKTLTDQAMEARACAYAPYSGFQVGAALVCQDGTVFTGCNMENRAYGSTLCAERVAVGKAISSGNRAFRILAIVGIAKALLPLRRLSPGVGRILRTGFPHFAARRCTSAQGTAADAVLLMRKSFWNPCRIRPVPFWIRPDE